MSCFRPLQAWQTEGGEVVFSERGAIRRPLVLPCGQCIGCRLERSRQWATRCMHESSLHDFSSFVTLTYDEDHCPDDLIYWHFQKFMKRLRKEFGPTRFFMCGEYGERFKRPHFHACLFGCFFSDRVLHSNDGGFKLYRSAKLDRLWPLGFASVGDVTFESAAYVARYCMKKVTGDAADAAYSRLNLATGEVFSVTPEFCHMSTNPGIGKPWLDEFAGEVLDHGNVVTRGHLSSIPRFYRRKLADIDSDRAEALEFLAYDRMTEEVLSHTSPSRLAAREIVLTAQMSQFNRRLE